MSKASRSTREHLSPFAIESLDFKQCQDVAGGWPVRPSPPPPPPPPPPSQE